jgi:hypothetical protein
MASSAGRLAPAETRQAVVNYVRIEAFIMIIVVIGNVSISWLRPWLPVRL